MYSVFVEIFEKTDQYLKVIRELKEDIQDVYIYNKVENSFGKKYCRIYVEINLIPNPSHSQYEIEKYLYNNFENFGIKPYFSFYLGSSNYNSKDEILENREEQMHYYYIHNLLEWELKKVNIKVNVDKFESEYSLKKDRIKEDEKRELEKQKITAEISPFIHKEGRLIVINSYDKLRIGKIIEAKTLSNNISLLEVKKDFTIGKIKLDSISINEILAIIDQSLLGKITKEELIELIITKSDFKGLEWKREY
ncbi:hypothetical protein [Flavobacterium sp. WC2429]|uniref:Uncharacterized protein n=1 Tax=Flavobacterium sp. WC2429 TaxID=3234140 RepID=A0AB39WI13_9FLAO